MTASTQGARGAVALQGGGGRYLGLQLDEWLLASGRRSEFLP